MSCWRIAWFVAGTALLAGCGSSRPPAAMLLNEVNATEREVLAIDPDPVGSEAFRVARVQRDTAASLVQKGQEKRAAPILERSLAGMREARAFAEYRRADEEARRCRGAVEEAERRWEEAIILLEQTERVARRQVSQIPREDPEVAAFANPTVDWPGVPSGADGPVSLESQQKGWNDWAEQARARKVAIADIEARFRALVDPITKGVKPEEKFHRLFQSESVLREMAARVMAADAREDCARGALLAARLGDARDDALRATLDLERTLRDDLRAELEREREEARKRQTGLYDALKQIEGKYAHITQTARGAIVSLADILFDFDKATLKRNVEFSLVKVSTILNQFPEMKVAVEGHTDNIGKPEYNLDLSKRRAQAVYEFLVSQDVAAERMTVEGYGLTRPVADNGTEEGRQRNRRVDLVVEE